jgi:hypothetical protein
MLRLARRSLLLATSALIASGGPAFAATGDITAITIEATGWTALVTVAGFTTGETFAFGDPILSVAKFALTVTTTGFDATGTASTPVHTSYGTHIVRDAYPSNATNNETLGGGGVIVRISLSEWIASGDTVVANVAAGCFVNTGGSAQTSNVLSALTCTNSSTYAHPAAFGQWASRPYDRWQANPTLSVTARHRYGAACVKIILSDGTNTVTTTATKQSNQRLGANASGLYAEEWTATPSLSTLTQNIAITARFQIFPAIGASCDSNNTTSGAVTFTNGSAVIGYTSFNPPIVNQTVKFTTTGGLPTGFSTATTYFVIATNLTASTFSVATSAGGTAVSASSAGTGTQTVTTQNLLAMGLANRPFWCDKSAALDVFAVVSVSGNDSTGVSSASQTTAAASPYATIAKALTVGTANVIFLRSAGGGTYVLGGATSRPADLNYWRRILPYPGDSTITITIAAIIQPNVQALSFENVTFKIVAGSNQWIDGQNTDVFAWLGCAFNSNGITSNTVPVIGGYQSIATFVNNCTFDDTTNWGLAANFVAVMSLWYDGSLLPAPSANSILVGVHRFVANKVTNSYLFDSNTQASTAPKFDPLMIEFNSMLKCPDGNDVISYFYQSLYGLSLVGNIFERVGGIISAFWQINADANTFTARHMVIWHNTVAGARCNMLYNDAGTAPFLMTGVSMKFNSFWQTAIKTDTFGTPNANRIGNWSDVYGVGHVGNQEQTNNLGFCNEFAGIGIAFMPTTPLGVSPVSTPNYTLDASINGTNAGGGNYLPTAGSTLINGVPAGYGVLGWDQTGKAISNAGQGTAGALQIAAAGGGGHGNLMLMGVG